MPLPAPDSEPHARPSIAIIGLGPRGASLIERLGVHLSALPDTGPLDLLLIDDAEPGSGRIWRTDQTRELCMNTLADAVSLFTEPGSTVTGDVVEGPTLYEWCVLAREAGPGALGAAAIPQEIPPARAAAFRAYPARAGLAADYRAELAELRPESHPSRALYGEYLAWFFARAVAELPDRVRVIHHRARAIDVERVGGVERITLDREVAPAATPGTGSGRIITASTVIAATGWLPRAATPDEAALEAKLGARTDLTWVRQGSPVEQDLAAILPGERAIVRGLGMGFFDTVTLLTLGRGGSYAPDAAAPGGLRYLPSGREPILHVTSRRGVPFRAKSRYGGLPPRAPQALLREVDWSAVPRPVDFDTQLWPRIVGDAFLAHAATLRRVRPGALGTDPDAALARIESAVRAAIAPLVAGTRPSGAQPAHLPAAASQAADPHPSVTAQAGLEATVDAVAAAVAPHIPDPSDRFDLAGEIRPANGRFPSPRAFDAWVSERVAGDLREVDLGEASPLKAGLWSVSSARGLAGEVGTLGGFDAESRASGSALLTSLGGMVGSGPPAFRNNELLALAAAGIVHFIGPDAALDVDDSGFVASSPAVTGSEVSARALIDSWMHFHDARASTDPLTSTLLRTGRARVFEIASRAAHTPVATAGIDIDPATGLLLGADGSPDPAFHLSGIPVDDTLHGTVISPMPGTDPPMLRETDRVALSALRIALSSVTTPHPTPHPEGALIA